MLKNGGWRRIYAVGDNRATDTIEKSHRSPAIARRRIVEYSQQLLES
jgi:hypothetical protein